MIHQPPHAKNAQIQLSKPLAQASALTTHSLDHPVSTANPLQTKRIAQPVSTSSIEIQLAHIVPPPQHN